MIDLLKDSIPLDEAAPVTRDLANYEALTRLADKQYTPIAEILELFQIAAPSVMADMVKMVFDSLPRIEDMTHMWGLDAPTPPQGTVYCWCPGECKCGKPNSPIRTELYTIGRDRIERVGESVRVDKPLTWPSA